MSHKRLRILAALVASVLVIVAAGLTWLHRRALPTIDGQKTVAGVPERLEIVRDSWGVPHIFAGSEDGAYFGLGFAVAQDRLFQLELLRHVGQGRLAELFGKDLVDVDRLFRTMDLHGIGSRRLARAHPAVQSAFRAYAKGINAALLAFPDRTPIELTLLGRRFDPAKADDFIGVLGFMVWSLQIAWDFEPAYAELVERVGAERAASLFPLIGDPPVFARPRETRAVPFTIPPAGLAFLEGLPRLAASNTWALSPARSATGHAILANDPHLDIGLPSTWYQAHLVAPGLDVIGATLPGLPFVVIGHNRDIAWGLTNLMLDSGDFFIEKLRGGSAEQALSKGTWVDVRRRSEEIRVKGAPPVATMIRETPHGPIVSDLMPGQEEALSFQWSYAAAEHTNDAEAFYRLDRARDWNGFREAVRLMGGVSQNVSYADGHGHIGMQATGAIPCRKGRADGLGYRIGSDGSEDWEGFLPFEENPWTIDPAEGWVAASNNATFGVAGTPYITALWEPPDRYARVRDMIAAKPKLAVSDVQAMHRDVRLHAAPSVTMLIEDAFAQEPPSDPRVQSALTLVSGWDGEMGTGSAAAALFAAWHKHLFYEIFEDEMGEPLARRFRTKANVSAIMMREALRDPSSAWLDRRDSAEREDRATIVRRAFVKAVGELGGRLGGDPASWRWGRLHTLTLKHPLGSVSSLAPYFNLGPYEAPGHGLTVFKEEAHDADFGVYMGPSLRQITDMGDVAHGLSVIPGGQSGVRASKHYGDLLALWRRGEYHPLLLEREEILRAAEGRLVLLPSGSVR